MKKIYTLLALALMGLTPLALTSCVFNDDDDYVANSLQGIWRGQIQSEYYYGRYGHDVQYTDTQLEFYSDPYSYASGRGREIDYNYSYYGEEVYFNYTVRDRVIFMDYSSTTTSQANTWHRSGCIVSMADGAARSVGMTGMTIGIIRSSRKRSSPMRKTDCKDRESVEWVNHE